MRCGHRWWRLYRSFRRPAFGRKGNQRHGLGSREPGFGASGRNGGQVNPGWYITPDQIRKLYGSADGERVIQLVDGACDLVFQLIEQHQISCEAVRPGFVQGNRAPGDIPKLKEKTRQWREVGVDVQMLDAASSSTLLGTPAYLSAMYDPRGGNLQPLSYCRGLARAALTAGARICKQARVTSLHRQGSRWRVETATGSINAEKVAFCTNGYTDDAWPKLKRSVVPVASVQAATEPLLEDILEHILPQRHAVSETSRMFYYYKRDDYGRFHIGCAGPVFTSPDKNPLLKGKEGAEQYFPILKNAKWEFGWGGYVAITPTGQPRLMQIADGVYAGLAYYGRGVAMATAMGKELCAHLLNQETHIPASDLKQIPLHEFHKLGVSARILGFKIMDLVSPT